MSYEKKSRKKLLTLTVLTLLSTISVVSVYAVLIGTFYGGEVTIGGDATGAITYSADQSTWTPTLSTASAADAWYSRISVNGGKYSGTAVTIDWQLQRKTSETGWSDVGTPTTTSMTLAAGSQEVYVTTNGGASGNRDWGQDVTEQGTYRVVVDINSS